MTRGFITIATGKQQYYKIAANLVLSYRYYSKNPLPFAIIAEEENEFTSLFDHVIITTESTHSFLDKFLLLRLCPYEETIFVDADCLAYGDLNEYWDFFQDATDFSATGVNVPLHQSEGVWYDVEDIGKYGKMISYKTRIHAGVCFIRKSNSLEKMYHDCLDIYQNFDKLKFRLYPHSVDECVLGVAMPMNQMQAIPEKAHMLAAYPCLLNVQADIIHGRLSYSTTWAGHTERGILLHWGTNQTYKALYRFEIACLQYLLRLRNRKSSLWEKVQYEFKFKLITMKLSDAVRSLWRAVRKRVIIYFK